LTGLPEAADEDKGAESQGSESVVLNGGLFHDDLLDRKLFRREFRICFLI
jgi:hypothetical protein